MEQNISMMWYHVTQPIGIRCLFFLFFYSNPFVSDDVLSCFGSILHPPGDIYACHDTPSKQPFYIGMYVHSHRSSICIDTFFFICENKEEKKNCNYHPRGSGQLKIAHRGAAQHCTGRELVLSHCMRLLSSGIRKIQALALMGWYLIICSKIVNSWTRQNINRQSKTESDGKQIDTDGRQIDHKVQALLNPS